MNEKKGKQTVIGKNVRQERKKKKSEEGSEERRGRKQRLE